MTGARAGVFAGLLFAAAALSPSAASGDGAAALVEREFAAAIRTVTPATVFLTAKESAETPMAPFLGSSGVIITRNGYVLSDGDAGLYYRPKTGDDGAPVKGRGGRQAMVPVRADTVEVRLPDLKRGTYEVFTAKVVRRVMELDSTLLKIDPPSGRTFTAVTPGDSDHLEVGHFSFAMGMTFGNSTGGASSLTGGVIAALVPQAAGAEGGRWADLYTSAAVNPGVNGGPLVDVEGRLIGVISHAVDIDTKDPFQCLGKAFPIDRLRHAYRDVPNAASIFPDARSLPARSKDADLLEEAFAQVATRAYPSVVSIEAKSPPLYSMRAPVQGGQIGELKRYRGPFSGVVASADGWIVTSLYNVADVLPLVFIGAAALPNTIEETVGQWKDLTVHFPGGPDAPARIVAHDQRLGLALLKADLPAGFTPAVLPQAPAEEFRQGHLLMTVSNPFGSARLPSPLVTIGMLSRIHPEGSGDPWEGALQTDSGATDATCGGAILDMQGRLMAVATIWNPPQHGRNSGIGFGIPWARVEEALPGLEAGKSRRIGGVMGIVTMQEPGKPVTIKEVAEGSPAKAAGVKAGDVVVSVAGVAIQEPREIMRVMRWRGPGEVVHLTVRRGTQTLEFDVELQKRSEAQAEPAAPGPTPGEPGKAEGGMSEPGMGEPGMSEPGMDEGGMDDPGMSDAGMSP